MMNSREIIQATLDFQGPERVGRTFGDGDFVGMGHTAETQASDWQQVDEKRWERRDEWGNLWARIDRSSKGEVAESVLKSLDEAEGYEFPDFSRPADYQQAREVRLAHPDKFALGQLPGFAFNIARKLLKMDNYLVALMLDRGRLRELHDRIDSFLEDMIGNYAVAGTDAVSFSEDWGTQSQTLVSPALWREEFFPRFKRLCGLAHEAGLKVRMHSCGKITAIIGGLMEAGVDMLQFDQPTLHGIDTLAGFQERGKISFECPVDIQKTLQSRDETVIRAGAREMLDKLWKGRGGFVAGYYVDNESIGLTPEVQDWACDEFVKLGVAQRYR